MDREGKEGGRIRIGEMEREKREEEKRGRGIERERRMKEKSGVRWRGEGWRKN